MISKRSATPRICWGSVGWVLRAIVENPKGPYFDTYGQSPGKDYVKMVKYLKGVLESIGITQVDLIPIPEDYLDAHYPYAPSHKGFERFVVLR